MHTRTKLAVALSVAALALVTGCKGDTGPAGPEGPPGPPGPGGDAGGSGIAVQVPSNSEAPTDETNAAWAALQPQVTVQSVTISSPPRVTFKVTTASGSPIVGLGNTSKSSTATVAGLTNLAFAIAKLVPLGNGANSHWVSYIVTTVPTLTADGGTTSPGPTRPSTDNTGTLTDNGDGFGRGLEDRVLFAHAGAPQNITEVVYSGSLLALRQVPSFPRQASRTENPRYGGV